SNAFRPNPPSAATPDRYRRGARAVHGRPISPAAGSPLNRAERLPYLEAHPSPRTWRPDETPGNSAGSWHQPTPARRVPVSFPGPVTTIRVSMRGERRSQACGVEFFRTLGVRAHHYNAAPHAPSEPHHTRHTVVRRPRSA